MFKQGNSLGSSDLWTSKVIITKMAKEKNYNPVQAQRKADKAKAIKKGALSHDLLI